MLTDEDRAALQAIANELDDRVRVRLLHDYWRDQERTERAPRWVMALHLGLLAGMCERLLEQQTTSMGGQAAPVSWSEKREKAD